MAATAQVLEFPRDRSSKVRPEAMIGLPDDNRLLVRKALEIIDICRSDAGMRAAYYRQINQIVETGRVDGTRSLINLLYRLLDRLSSFLFSPTGLRFACDFENEYQPETLARGLVSARLLGRSWERSNTDIIFAQAVFEALKYGSAILKQWCTQDGDGIPHYHASIVMPWQFGVYRPTANFLDAQPAMVETVMLTMPEVWRRIWHMPDARELFQRIMQHAMPGDSSDIANSFVHNVLSTSQISTGVGGPQRPTPGGIVQLSTDPNFTGINPGSAAPMVAMHELWMWGETDYITVQIIEPDILIAPRFRRSNLLVSGHTQSGLHPYTLVQPNMAWGNIWGRSEIADLIEPAQFLADTAYDVRRLFGLQVDKVLAFNGNDDLTDERYDQFRAAGYVNTGPGGSVTDLTPQFPAQALPLLDKIIQLMEMISGFDNLLSGRGEPGVRSGAQANPMMQTAGAPVKDRALVVERQCAAAADLRFALMKVKDGRTYWTDAAKMQETSFLLGDLPDDARMVVDGHTSSPIFAAEHQALIIGGLKLGLVDKESALEQLPFENRDLILARLKAEAAKQGLVLAEIQKKDPEEYAKIIAASVGGKRH